MYSINRTWESVPIGKNRFALLVLFILVELLILYAFIQGNMVIVLGVILGLVFLIFSAFSVERSFYLMALYYIATPEKGYAHLFPGWGIFFSWYLGLPLFIWLFGNWLLYLIRNQIHNEPLSNEPNLNRRVSFRTMDKLLLIFIGAFSFSAVLGILRGFNRFYWAWNYLALLMYLVYFIFLYSPLSIKPRRLFDFAVLCSLFASIQYINSATQLGATVVLTRLMSEHIHLTPLVLIYLGATILYSSGKLRRLLSTLIFPIVLVGLLLSQQRSLYGSVFITLIMLLAFFAYDKRHYLFRNATKITYGIVATIIFFGGLYILLQNLTQGRLLTTVFTRVLVFLSPKMIKYDISAITRVSEIKNALNTVGNDFLFGRGLGDAVVTRWREVEQITVDNTFAFLYWKTGLVGLISFIAVIFYFLKRCITTLRKNLLVEEKIYVLTAFLNIVGLLIVSVFNVCLAAYRPMLIWAATFAVVELIARKYEKKTFQFYATRRVR
ncbi:MAG: hypothetical protein OEZ20_02885 [candidate division WOR-3 bacterium]|nr:hypothetical protein [candidate division WOR-3 bacterium]MDH5683392.1 hypothetical protein [candidate division WOR-3 bacterium]